MPPILLTIHVFLICFLSPYCGARQAIANVVDHSLFRGLLVKYVKDGKVDYAGFKTEEKQLDAYLEILGKTDPVQLVTSEQFAFYINAYNAWTIKLILGGYPGLTTIWDLGGRLWGKPFQKKIAWLNGRTMSLDEIENQILRPRFRDERVHFAINCASRSCPPLRSEPYIGEGLDRQLEEMASAFINNPDYNRLEGRTLYVSKIFKWYQDDFKSDLVEYFKRYATGGLKEKLIADNERIRIRYMDYDWSLNDQR